jgi:hypothetical protein
MHEPAFIVAVTPGRLVVVGWRLTLLEGLGTPAEEPVAGIVV